MEITRGTLNAIYVLIYFNLRPYGEVVDLHTLSETLEVPQSYLSKILQQLHKSGYLVSMMGSKGGYRLAKNVDHVSMKEVVHAMQGDKLMQECLFEHFNCERFKKCAVLGHVRSIQNAVEDMLDQLTIGKLSAEMQFKDQQQERVGQIGVGVQ